MRVALDTNILVRYWNTADPGHSQVVRLLDRVSDQSPYFVAPQNLYELWVVATRPSPENGLGLQPEQAGALLDKVMRTCILLPDPPDLVFRWMQLCTTAEIRGRRAHDARLAAWMQCYQIKHIATLNPADFERLPHIECISR